MIRARRVATSLVVAFAGLAAPAIVAAHQLNSTYASRLPLVVYLAGAAATVALSFIFVLVRDVRADRPDTSGSGTPVPAPVRVALRAVGLIGWLWIMVQGIAGGESSGDVATLFLWIYGWVGIPIISAFIGPIWRFVDPFSTLYDLGAWLIRRIGVDPWEVAAYPSAVGRWPAVIGFLGVIWLELVLMPGPQILFVILVGYTALTLAMMAQFGKEAWRSNGEIFSVWFGLLGRIAPYALVGDDRVRRRSFASGLLEPGWRTSDVVMIAFGVGSILFDGLSQTQVWYDTFGFPLVPKETLLLAIFVGVILAAALAVTRVVGVSATGAGLLPIAIGYLVAHYFTYLFIDGQRIVVALSDPLQRGWDLFGTAFYEPSASLLPPGLVWTIQLAAVVGGHMLGAWGGHVVASLEAPRGLVGRALTVRQVPLAVVMVGLTTLTLWSLGQAIVVTPQQPAAQTMPTAVTSQRADLTP
jgi:hypothetical protein